MPSSGTDLRTGPRAAVDLELRLERRHGRPLNARTVDLSTGGARVRSARPLRIDEELRFDVGLPAGRSRVEGTARVLRQDRHDVYALRFESLAPATLADLRAFVDATAASPLL
jgi:c-di-GMP-binding flagellar brake protein YcgR